jgi:hypothetical protein
MGKPYYLIDFENVQPRALGLLKPGESRIKVFLGQQQTKVMLELVQALQPFGTDAEYIAINGTGPDAVDFHIAYYIGRIAAQEPGATFRIVSKDTGFDPLVRHLGTHGIACQRLAQLPGTVVAKAPQAKAATPATKAVKKVAKKATKAAKKTAVKNVVVTVEPAVVPGCASADDTTATRVKTVLAYLRKSTRPSKVAGLRASIRSWFKPAPDEAAIDAVLHSLVASRKIAINATTVTYALD